MPKKTHQKFAAEIVLAGFEQPAEAQKGHVHFQHKDCHHQSLS